MYKGPVVGKCKMEEELNQVPNSWKGKRVLRWLKRATGASSTGMTLLIIADPDHLPQEQFTAILPWMMETHFMEN